ncbi:MAG: CHAT domain-containing protein [Planctomycetota bacterium]
MAEPSEPADDPIAAILLGYGRAVALRNLRRFEESSAAFLTAGRRAAEMRWLARASVAHGQPGEDAYERADLQGALRAFEESLRIDEARGRRGDVAGTLVNMGLVHASLGEFSEGLKLCELGLLEAEAAGHRPWAANALANIGAIHVARGDYARARSYVERVRTFYEEVGDRTGLAKTLGNLGVIHQFLGEYAEALRCEEEALSVCEAVGDLAGVSRALSNIGDIHHDLGDLTTALACQERALKLAEEFGDRRAITSLLNNIGNLHSARGNLPKALEFQGRALKLARETGDRSAIARALGNSGCVQRKLGDCRKALEFQEQALKLSEEIGDLGLVARTLDHIAGARRSLGDYPGALAYEERALAQADALGDRETVVRCLWGLSWTHLARGEAAPAAALARRAVGIVGRLATGLAEEEGARAREQFAGVFETGALAGLRLGDPAEVCFFLESGRAATLLEMLGGRDAIRAAAVPEGLRVEEEKARAEEAVALGRHKAALGKGARAEIGEARRALDEARERVNGAIARVQRQAKAGAAVVYPEADSLDAIRWRVREGETLVLYAICEEAIALVVTREKARIVRLGEVKAIEDAFAGDAVEAAEAIRKLVVDPLGLPETGRVLVSPVGALCYVPFALLLGDREVAYLPSATTYGVLLDDAGKRGEGVLALGDPDYDTKPDPEALTLMRGGTALTPLPGTREEAKAVGDVVLLGKDATEAGLLDALAQRPRWRAVHLGCHGLVDPERPRLSSLALSGGDFVSTLEVFRLRAPADLVVLSACETARGKVYRTEGVVGFVRGFMFAGAPRVLVSLWKVDDEATRALMVKFYELWKPGTMGAAAALRAAQEHVRSQPKWKHPYYWAAWQLWGLPD